MLKELARKITEVRGFKTMVIDHGTHEVIEVYVRGHRCAFIRLVDGKLRAGPSQLRSNVSGYYGYPNLDSVNVSPARGLEAVFKDLDRRFLSYLEEAAEPVIEELERWDNAENESRSNIKVIAQLFGEVADSHDVQNKTYWHRMSESLTVSVDARYTNLEVKLSGLTIEQLKKVVEVLK